MRHRHRDKDKDHKTGMIVEGVGSTGGLGVESWRPRFLTLGYRIMDDIQGRKCMVFSGFYIVN